MVDHVVLFRFTIRLQDGVFQTYPDKPSRWTHVVLNYFGPDDGQGITIHYNGAQVGSDTRQRIGTALPGDGRIVVGRRFTGRNRAYASIEVDELIFFNKFLGTTDIAALYNIF